MIFGKPPSPPPTPSAPIAPPTVATSAGDSSTTAEALPPRETILLVDDSNMVRSMVAKTLAAHRFVVIAADSGLAALSEWDNRKAEIKLVLSDVFMPGMDGLTLGKKLRQKSRTLPIILMSSKLDDDSRWIAEEAGFRLLAKPFKDELLIELINRMLRLAYPS